MAISALGLEVILSMFARNMPRIRLDLPLPDTPVTAVRWPIGILASTFLRLLRVADLI